jgi:hypothetical protein
MSKVVLDIYPELNTWTEVFPQDHSIHLIYCSYLVIMRLDIAISTIIQIICNNPSDYRF